MTHDVLIEIGKRWLKPKCAVVLKEIKTTTTEIPDVIGFNSAGTFLIEAKTSRADFFADRKKPFRLCPQNGVGDWRFFIIPSGLVTIEELPKMWGLIEVNEKGIVETVYNPFGNGNVYGLWLKNDKNTDAERFIMYSALRRIYSLTAARNVIENKIKI